MNATGLLGLCEKIHLFMCSVIKFDSCCIRISICQIKEVIITISQPQTHAALSFTTQRVSSAPMKETFLCFILPKPHWTQKGIDNN